MIKPVNYKHWRPYQLIALSGKIASGKSFALKCFAHLGFNTLSADNIVKSVYADFKIMKEVFNKLNLAFPSSSLSTDNLMQIAKIWALKNSQNLKLLSEILAPFIKQKRQLLLEQMRAKSSKAIIYEIPLLHETGQEEIFDYIINLICPYHIRLARALKRHNISKEDFDKIDKLQAEDQARIKKSDIIIHSSYSKKAVLEQIKRIIKYDRNNTRYRNHRIAF